MSNVYGKVDISDGLSKTADIGGTGLSGVVIGNDSGFTCKVTLQGANVARTLYAGTADFFPIAPNQSWTGNVLIEPSADLNNISFWPGAFIYIDTFGPNEVPSGTYPMNLNRTGNIGNQVTTVSGSATSVQNDNNGATTEFIEATVLGSPMSNEAHLVDGSGWIGRWVNPTFTKVFQWFSSGSTALTLAAAGLLTHILGSLTVDQNLTVTGNATLTGTATFNAAGASIDGSSNFNGNATNTSVVNTGTVNSGSGGVNINSGGNLLVSGGKVGSVTAGDMLDASDGSNMYVKCIGAAGKVIFQTPNGTSVATIYKSSTNGSALQLVNASAAAVDTLYIDNANEVVIQLATNTKRFYVADTAGVKLFSVDNLGNVRAKGTVTASTTP